MGAVKTYLRSEIKAWAHVGHPALMQRFVAKHGKEFAGSSFAGRRGTPKQCFRNAAHRAFSRSCRNPRYFEGYAICRNIGFAFHHAWNVEAGKVVDVTLRNPEDYDYMGVEFSRRELAEQQLQSGVYGVLDTGRGVNIDLMRDVDLKLVDKALSVRADPAFAKMASEVRT